MLLLLAAITVLLPELTVPSYLPMCLGAFLLLLYIAYEGSVTVACTLLCFFP